MKKNFIKVFVCIFVCLLCLCGGLALGLTQEGVEIDHSSQIVGDYDLTLQERNTTWKRIEKNIVINKNKVCDITQLVTVEYKNPGINVGITLQVARVNQVTRFWNGKKYVTKTIANLDNLSARVKSVDSDFVEEFSEIENSGEFYYLNIGELRHYKASGEYTFEVNYRYDFGADFISDFDDFTFDLMDYDYIQPVGEFEATVTLPEKFLGEEQQIQDILSFRTNEKKELGFEAVQANYDQKTLTISCKFPGVVPVKTGLTMQLILDNNYFETYFTPNTFYYVVLAIAILAVLLIVLILILSRLGQKPVITVEFYPPKGYNPIDVARIYRGNVRAKDFASIYLYWASQDLIEIKSKGDKQFLMKKLHDFPEPVQGEDNYLGKKREKEFFDAHFKDSIIYDTAGFSKHDKAFIKAVDKMYQTDENKNTKQIIFKLLIQLLSIIPMILFIIWNILYDSSIGISFLIFLFPFIALMVFIHARMGWAMIWFKIIWCAGFGIVPFIAFKGFLFLTYDIYNIFWFLVAIMIVGSFAVKLVKIRTIKNMSLYGKVLGFKQFLVKVEVDKLERMIYDDPKYYLDILPFCYVFDITKVMEKKFESMHIILPSLSPDISVALFISSLSRLHTMAHISHISSSRGGFSGGGGGHGGSSGGGGGGGGGRGR